MSCPDKCVAERVLTNIGFLIWRLFIKYLEFNFQNYLADKIIGIFFANTVISNNDLKMGIVERKQRQKEEVREQILRAAWTLVQEEGWQALSIRKIADAIEYSVPVIYTHFENKDAIMQEFTAEGFRKLNAGLQTVLEQPKEPAEKLASLARAYWDFAFQNKEYYQLMYGLGMPTCEKVRQVPELSKFTNLLQDAIKELIFSSKNTGADSFLKFHTFWSLLHGLVSINLIEQTACPDSLHHLVLEDAVQGFIKNIQR